MTSLPAKVIAVEQIGDQFHVVVQIAAKYRGSFNTLAFGEINPTAVPLTMAGWI